MQFSAAVAGGEEKVRVVLEDAHVHDALVSLLAAVGGIAEGVHGLECAGRAGRAMRAMCAVRAEDEENTRGILGRVDCPHTDCVAASAGQ